MLARRRMIEKLRSWSLILTTLAVGFAVMTGSLRGSAKKVQANRIISPWDISAAPPQFLSRCQIKITPHHIPEVKAPARKERQYRRYARHRRHWNDEQAAYRR